MDEFTEAERGPNYFLIVLALALFFLAPIAVLVWFIVCGLYL